MNYTLRVSTLLFVLSFAGFAGAFDKDTQFCGTDNYGHYWVVHVDATSQGHANFFGHVHNTFWPKSYQCYDQWFVGAGTIYPIGHAKHNLAEFTLTVPDGRWCPAFSLTVSGDIRNRPIVYTGSLNYGRNNYPITLTFEFDSHNQSVCSDHP